MVKSGKTNTEVEEILKDTNSGGKNEILWRDFGINYNTLEEVNKKGSVIGYFPKAKKESPSKDKTEVEKIEEKKE